MATNPWATSISPPPPPDSEEVDIVAMAGVVAVAEDDVVVDVRRRFWYVRAPNTGMDDRRLLPPSPPPSLLPPKFPLLEDVELLTSEVDDADAKEEDGLEEEVSADFSSMAELFPLKETAWAMVDDVPNAVEMLLLLFLLLPSFIVDVDDVVTMVDEEALATSLGSFNAGDEDDEEVGVARNDDNDVVVAAWVVVDSASFVVVEDSETAAETACR